MARVVNKLMPKYLNRDLNKMVRDVEWAVRMMRESETPEAVSVDNLAKDVAETLAAAQQWRARNA